MLNSLTHCIFGCIRQHRELGGADAERLHLHATQSTHTARAANPPPCACIHILQISLQFTSHLSIKASGLCNMRLHDKFDEEKRVGYMDLGPLFKVMATQ